MSLNDEELQVWTGTRKVNAAPQRPGEDAEQRRRDSDVERIPLLLAALCSSYKLLWAQTLRKPR